MILIIAFLLDNVKWEPAQKEAVKAYFKSRTKPTGADKNLLADIRKEYPILADRDDKKLRAYLFNYEFVNKK